MEMQHLLVKELYMNHFN